ncbi:DUF4252 domain-containing protein [Winogradskyella sp.]|jgi:hypothetical protein|uniref:DUF4252 domain-containing protein n=1 Tax=Winogradskyella sp. TaxID=1883156 RepID=UPI0025D53A16|nr:DUF4252 domain-containing protein [Winogradskyella sp.]MCT4629994.1 DUF4252 domain-containing protein [Winogradskyella sp.]
MVQSIKKTITMLLLVVAFTSCNQGPTLQTYFVDNELKPGFISGDAPASLLNVENIDLTKEQKEAYESIDKLNFLAFTIDESNKEEYKVELDKVKTILKDPRYQELMRGGNSTDGKFTVKFIGEVERIDELILFGNANDRGFVVARVLGDDMNAGKLMSLQSVLKDMNFDDTNLNGLTDFFK